MARYIDAVECAEVISKECNIPLGDLVDVFAKVPTADVVEVVRCKDCKHWVEKGYDPIFERKFGYCYNYDFPFQCEEKPIVEENDFCSYGKKVQ